MSSIRKWAPDALAALLGASGVVHLVHPQPYLSIMPSALPESTHLSLVYASGVIEIVCAAGLVARRQWAGPASALLLLAVWPSNLQYAVDATHSGGLASGAALLGWARMPLQIPLIWAALQSAPRADRTNRS